MNKLLDAVVAVFGDKKLGTKRPHVGVFSAVHGERGSLKKLGVRAANAKCAGECTCRCG